MAYSEYAWCLARLCFLGQLWQLVGDRGSQLLREGNCPIPIEDWAEIDRFDDFPEYKTSTAVCVARRHRLEHGWNMTLDVGSSLWGKK